MWRMGPLYCDLTILLTFQYAKALFLFICSNDFRRTHTNPVKLTRKDVGQVLLGGMRFMLSFREAKVHSFSSLSLFIIFIQDCGLHIGCCLSTFAGPSERNSIFSKLSATSTTCTHIIITSSTKIWVDMVPYTSHPNVMLGKQTAPSTMPRLTTLKIFILMLLNGMQLLWNGKLPILLLYILTVIRFVDDVMYKVAYDSSVYNGKPFAIDTSPHYFILNTAVGGRHRFYVCNILNFALRILAWRPNRRNSFSAISLYLHFQAVIIMFDYSEWSTMCACMDGSLVQLVVAMDVVTSP